MGFLVLCCCVYLRHNASNLFKKSPFALCTLQHRKNILFMFKEKKCYNSFAKLCSYIFFTKLSFLNFSLPRNENLSLNSCHLVLLYFLLPNWQFVVPKMLLIRNRTEEEDRKKKDATANKSRRKRDK